MTNYNALSDSYRRCRRFYRGVLAIPPPLGRLARRLRFNSLRVYTQNDSPRETDRDGEREKDRERGGESERERDVQPTPFAGREALLIVRRPFTNGSLLPAPVFAVPRAQQPVIIPDDTLCN